MTSHAQYDAMLQEQAGDTRQRDEGLRHEAAERSEVRRRQRVHQHGSLRFIGLCLTILATTLIVTLMMFQALALVAG